MRNLQSHPYCKDIEDDSWKKYYPEKELATLEILVTCFLDEEALLTPFKDVFYFPWP